MLAIFLKDLFRNLFLPINLTDLLSILLFILLSKLKNSYTKSIPLEKRGFIINWKGLEKQSLDETINALAMASPFTLEEKQILLEAKNLELRKTKISEILTTYSFDNYNNTTVQ